MRNKFVLGCLEPLHPVDSWIVSGEGCFDKLARAGERPVHPARGAHAFDHQQGTAAHVIHVPHVGKQQRRIRVAIYGEVEEHLFHASRLLMLLCLLLPSSSLLLPGRVHGAVVSKSCWSS